MKVCGCGENGSMLFHGLLPLCINTSNLVKHQQHCTCTQTFNMTGSLVKSSDPEPETVSLVFADWSLEEDDVLLVEVFCVDLVRWWHAVAVSEPMNVPLDVGLGVWTEALWL